MIGDLVFTGGWKRGSWKNSASELLSRTTEWDAKKCITFFFSHTTQVNPQSLGASCLFFITN